MRNQENPKEIPQEDRDPDHELRYVIEVVVALKECRTRYLGQRKALYKLLATVYAIALRMMEDNDAQARFFCDDYFDRVKPEPFESRRAFFRAVLKFVIDARSTEEIKRASKFASVLWHLDTNKVDPEDASSVIEISGGIEYVARHGIWKPTWVHPLDCGDGRGPSGERLCDSDEDQEDGETEDDAGQEAPDFNEVELDGDGVLLEFARGTEKVGGSVLMKAAYSLQPPLAKVRIFEVAPNEDVKGTNDFEWTIPDIHFEISSVLIAVRGGKLLAKPTTIKVVRAPLPKTKGNVFLEAVEVSDG